MNDDLSFDPTINILNRASFGLISKYSVSYVLKSIFKDKLINIYIFIAMAIDESVS